jgi:alpha-beta hydrolase superfamily lysophospholipase
MPDLITSTLTTPDGLTLYTAHIIPPSPRALVILVHGYGEHSGRYQHVIESLVGRGYAVYTLDHRAHGKSGGEPRALIHPLEKAITDLRQYVDAIKAERPALKRIMFGHSMGSAITFGYALRYPSHLDGVILSGLPLDSEKDVSPLLISIGKVLAKIIPSMPFSDLAPISGLAYNPAVAADFAADPLNYHGKMRIGMGVAIGDEASYLNTHLADLSLPVLMIHGEDDPICPPNGSQRAYDTVSSTDKTLKLYPKMKHEIMNEVDHQIVLDDVAAWLDAHSG